MYFSSTDLLYSKWKKCPNNEFSVKNGLFLVLCVVNYRTLLENGSEKLHNLWKNHKMKVQLHGCVESLSAFRPTRILTEAKEWRDSQFVAIMLQFEI